MMAFLNTGLEIRFRDERPGAEPDADDLQVRRRHRRLRHARQRRPRRPLFKKVGYFEQAEDDQEVEIAFQWNTGYNTDGLHSFANGITTIEGGMHEEGFKKALTNAVNKYAKAKGLLKEKDENLQGEDIREGLTAIISVRLREPAVRGPDQGQARQRLDALARRAGHQREAGRLARGAPDRGQARSSTKAIAGGPGPHRRPQRPATPPAASPRSRARACPTSSRTAAAATPTSASCSSSRATRPAARPPRPATRAPRRSCPIRGKILNVERARLDKMLKNNEIQTLISAIGAGVGEEFDVDQDPLPQGHPDVRRRRRRQPHPHAAAHVLLPPDEGRSSSTSTSTSPSRRCTPRWSAGRRST